MSFDDLEFLSFEIIEKHPEVLQSWQREWDFWFIDEFQDTSPLQKKILFSFLRTPWNSFFVGDPQQSVYLFRGSDENVFQETKKLVIERGGVLEHLEVNHRSHPDLVRFFNHVFSRLEPPMEPLKAREPEKGEIRATINAVTADLDEEDIVLAQVLEWHKLGHSFQDIAVLVRKNSKARTLGQKLAMAGVPVYVHSSGGFYDRREILDALALLTFLEDPSDDDAFVLIARSPWLGISDVDLAKWGSQRQKSTFWEWIKTCKPVREAYPVLVQLEKGVDDAEILPLSQVFSNLLENFGFWEFCLVDDASGRREANLRKLLWTLRSAEQRPNFSAAEFIDEAWSEILDTAEESEAASFIEPERVNIMTVHKSKGLKFNCVVVPFCGDAFKIVESPMELSPDGRWSTRVLSHDSEEKVGPLMHNQLRNERAKRELAESIRVFYVALTRAAEKLSLTGKVNYAPTSWFGQIKIPLTEGLHENTFNVKTWSEKPANEKIPGITETQLPTVELKSFHREDSQTSRLTVTQLVEKSTAVLAFQDQIEVQQRGQAIHYIFENMKGADLSKVPLLCQAAKRHYGISKDIEAETVLKTLKIKNPPLLDLIESGNTEWPFVIKDKGITLRGQIDLWGTIGDTTWIVDYKSSRKFTDENLKKAKDQLELYALAVSKTGVSWQKIKIAVVAPFVGLAQVLELSPIEEIRSRLHPMPNVLVDTEI